jgi:hypothetical protein
MRCWRRIQKKSWNDRVRNKVLQGVMEGKYIMLIIKRKKAN